MIGIVHTSTVTGAVHITAVFIGLSVSVVSVTNTTSVNVHCGISVDVAVFARAIHGSVHQGVA